MDGKKGGKQFLKVLLLAAAGGIVGILALSIAYRVSKAKPILRPDFPDVRFLETWRSGRSNRAVFAWLGEVRCCLWVAVTHDHLWVSPHFPMSLLFIPEGLHLDYRIPGHAILEMEEVLPRHRVRVRFRHATGEEDMVEVELKDPEAFKQAVRTIQSEVRSLSPIST
ncbi:MAG: hypothetical protein AB1555_07105 [Nitrospirota bacterium]